jgi:hypothetical protein
VPGLATSGRDSRSPDAEGELTYSPVARGRVDQSIQFVAAMSAVVQVSLPKALNPVHVNDESHEPQAGPGSGLNTTVQTQEP